MARRSPERAGAEFGRRHPLLAAVLVGGVLTGITVMFAAKLALALQVSPDSWAPGVAGAVLSMALLALAITASRRRALRSPSPKVVLAATLITLADFFCALGTPVSPRSSHMIVAIDAGATAFMIPLLAAMVLVIGWAQWTVMRRRRRADVGQLRHE